MKSLVMSVAALGLVVGLSSTGFADSAKPQSQTTGQPGKGNQGCVIGKNPGQLMQYLRGATDTSPGQYAAEQGVTLGILIDTVCGAPAAPPP